MNWFIYMYAKQKRKYVGDNLFLLILIRNYMHNHLISFFLYLIKTDNTTCLPLQFLVPFFFLNSPLLFKGYLSYDANNTANNNMKINHFKSLRSHKNTVILLLVWKTDINYRIILNISQEKVNYKNFVRVWLSKNR